MKNYINQIFEEGLGYSIYMPIEKIIKKKFSGSKKATLIFLAKLFYLVIAFLGVCILFYYGFPFK